MIILDIDVPLAYAAVGGLGLYVVWQLVRDWPLRKIPAVGYTFPILNWITAFRYMTDARALLQEGYDKYQPGVFRVAVLEGWQIIAAGTQFADEVRSAPDDVLNLVEWSARLLQTKYTMVADMKDDPYHNDVVRTLLTKNIGARFKDVRDEIATALEEEVGAGEGKGWKEVPAIETVKCIVNRVSNRLFVGLPLCRNREWIKLTNDYTMDVAKGGVLIKLTPGPLKLIVSKYLLTVRAQEKRALELLGPDLEERLRDFEENGEKWEAQSNDMLTWLIEAGRPRSRTAPLLANRMLLLNLVATFTTSATFVQALYRLAASPEYAELMREEAERVVTAEGWTKAAMNKLRRIDSFIRETQRLETLDMNAVNRWVMKPFTFSNGVRVPPGHALSIASDSIQRDTAHYGEDAMEFCPWRFSDIDSEDGEGLKHQMVATKLTQLNFGHGRHACPGRFFAAVELKCLLAHLVLEYDVRFKDGAGAPKSLEFASSIVLREAIVEFKRRVEKTKA